MKKMFNLVRMLPHVLASDSFTPPCLSTLDAWSAFIANAANFESDKIACLRRQLRAAPRDGDDSGSTAWTVHHVALEAILDDTLSKKGCEVYNVTSDQVAFSTNPRLTGTKRYVVVRLGIFASSSWCMTEP